MSGAPANHELARQLAVQEERRNTRQSDFRTALERMERRMADDRAEIARHKTRMLHSVAAIMALGITILGLLGVKVRWHLAPDLPTLIDHTALSLHSSVRQTLAHSTFCTDLIKPCLSALSCPRGQFNCRNMSKFCTQKTSLHEIGPCCNFTEFLLMHPYSVNSPPRELNVVSEPKMDPK